MIKEYFPMPHGTHSVLPMIALYLPALHSTHAPPSGPVDPALHVQLVFDELPAAECDPGMQIMQSVSAEFPDVSRYLPEIQL